MENIYSYVAENVKRVQNEIAEACIKYGRDPKEVILMGVSKTQPIEKLEVAYNAGITLFGENRVQELTQKLSDNAYEGADIHFIGHLQTNKVKQVVGKVSLIQSVDSLRLLEAIAKEAARQGIRQDILLEINIGDEESKSGLDRDEICQMLEKVAVTPSIRVRGLMAIPPICQNPGDNNKFFEEMCNLSVDIMRKKYDNVCMEILSMGMSDDYADAIAHGSTMIRVGTAIFGARNYAV